MLLDFEGPKITLIVDCCFLSSIELLSFLGRHARGLPFSFLMSSSFCFFFSMSFSSPMLSPQSSFSPQAEGPNVLLPFAVFEVLLCFWNDSLELA
jgi:hypothetical protein